MCLKKTLLKWKPLHTMAAYIDLNPVRAGLVKDPKDYKTELNWIVG